MNHIVSLAALFSLVASSLFAAAPVLHWVGINPDSQIHVVRQVLDAQGNLYVVCGTSGGGSSDINLVSFDPQGMLRWSQDFNSGSYDEPVALGLDGSGNVYVAGYAGYPRDFVVLKYSSIGESLWTRSFGQPADDDVAKDAVVDQQGNVSVIGTVRVGGGGLDQAVMAKWNADGDPLGVDHFGGPYSFPDDIAVDSRGQVSVGLLFPWENAIYINNHRYEGWRPIVLQHDNNDNLFAAFSRNDASLVLIKYGADGAPRWSKEEPIGGSSQYALRTGAKGDVILMESHYQDDGVYTRLWKRSAQGAARWSVSFTNVFTSLEGFAVGRNDEIFLGVVEAGWSASRLIGISRQGKVEWTIPAPGQTVAAVTADETGNFYVTGGGLVARYSTRR
jgi:hypothetical protein